MTGLLGYAASNIVPPMAQTISCGYVVALMLGIGLMLLDVLSNFVWWLTHRKGQSQKAVQTAEYSA